MILTFLKASIPLTKTFTKTPTGIEKSSYPNVYEVTSITEKCTDLKKFAVLLQKHADLGHCFLKGNVSKPLINESRAGSTDANAKTEIFLLDVDGLPLATPDVLMHLIGLGEVSYVVQYSASYLIGGDKSLRCHIFVQLNTPESAPILKQQLIALNFQFFRKSLTLTRTNNALHYGLDITTCQNDKLIYIAPPICKGFHAPKYPRIVYVQRKYETYDFTTQPSIMVNKAMIEKHIIELRELAKLPKRKNVYKLVNNTEILSKPDEAIISGIKEERGFTYFNFNGGDSWGYYHPSNNPDLIHNFKGEPTYLTKELLPEYWQQVSGKTTTASLTVKGVTFLAFLDRKTDSYFRGTYDGKTLSLYYTRNEAIIRQFAKQNGFSLPDFIPEWDMLFDPLNPLQVDTTNQCINTFHPTVYMVNKAPWTIKKTFPTIQRVIDHALGNEPAITARFLNWVAAIIQGLTQTRTAWVLHGRTGTGKGVLMNNILRQLLGLDQTASKGLEQLAEHYDGFLERCFLVMVDEVQTSTLRNEKGVMAKLKHFITEPTVSVRDMYQKAHQIRNYSNWIFASNMPDPVLIDSNDRRFNVGKYQPNEIVLTQKDIDAIAKELQNFYDFLAAYSVNLVEASTPMDTEDRKNLINIGESSIDTVAMALLNGDFGFFIDELPTNTPTSNVMIDAIENYKATMLRILERGPNCNISRDELHHIFEYTVGDMPKSPNKFTSRLKHHRIHMKPVRVEGILVRGLSVDWKIIPIDAKARLIGRPQSVHTRKEEK